MTHRARPVALAVALMLGAPLAAQDTMAPLSAIDWLSRSVTAAPAPAAPAPAAPRVDEPPVSDSALSPQVTVTPLDAPGPDGVGLLPPSMTGLPAALWAGSEVGTLIALMQAQEAATLPAVHGLLVQLLLAEATPPQGTAGDGAFFLARVDKLLDMGELAQAAALLEAAGPDTGPLFRRWFDVALLTGDETAACRAMQTQPGVAPTYPARIFCLARNGDWAAAALTLNTHRVLGDVSDEEELLLTRFLDAEFSDGAEPLPPPERISPLVFRMREAIGEPLATSGLPLAFAHADLRDTNGWKTQIDAAERLARAGALPGPVLQKLFTSRAPSASGGAWDRVEAFQRFDLALTRRDPGAVAASLPAAWAAMAEIRMEVPFAELYGPALQRLPLTGAAGDLARVVGLLSPEYEAVAQAGGAGIDPFLAAVARGTPGDAPATTEPARLVRAGFAPDAPVPAVLAEAAAAGRLGEALLRAIATFEAGRAGDPQQMIEALAFFRSVGLEDFARRAALQYLLLDRPT